MSKTIKKEKWPRFTLADWIQVIKVIASNQLFADRRVGEFENEYAKYIGSKYAVGVGNATQGLHLALCALEIGIGDEVIVTPYTWISSASCILMQNAVPVFADIEEETLGIDPKSIEERITDKTKAVICVHLFGIPCRIEEIKKICDHHNIALIEDNSHAHGAKVNGINTGTIGDISVASLHQRKSLPVGDGGIICTNSDRLREKVYRLRSFGGNELSYNYRMNEFAGAIGTSRLKRLDRENNIRAKRAVLIKEILQDNSCYKLIEPRMGDKSVYYAVLIKIKKQMSPRGKVKLDQIIERNKEIIRYTWNPLHKHPTFSKTREWPRGNVWKLAECKYSDNKYDKESKKLSVTEDLIPHKILEFYVHPTIRKTKIMKVAREINSLS